MIDSIDNDGADDCRTPVCFSTLLQAWLRALTVGVNFGNGAVTMQFD